MAERAAEHFVARTVGEDLAGVGDHTAHVRERIDGRGVFELVLHADEGVVEPPGEAEGDGVAEGARQLGQRRVVDGIHVVEDRLEAAVEAVKQRQEVGDVVGQMVGDVAADIRAEAVVERVAHVADGTDVDLEDPSFLGVHFGDFVEDVGHVGDGFSLRQRLAGEGLLEDGLRILLRDLQAIGDGDAMV